MKRKQLRSGYTTGACAAASAKAASLSLIRHLSSIHNNSEQKHSIKIDTIDISLPDGERATFKISKTNLTLNEPEITATTSTIKFAGDDPDVTNGAEIIASVTAKRYDSLQSNLDMRPSLRDVKYSFSPEIIITAGKGVGIVTKPGLPVPIHSPAINPVPQRMIKDAVLEAFMECGYLQNNIHRIEVTISVTDGEKLALKTLNPRLGIIKGISILGTTGIVKPLSSEAWTATISTSMDVAIATGCEDVVLSAGRTSEKAHIKKYHLPEESYVMMGDYLEFSLLEAKRHQFKRIHLCAQWAKMLKIAMSIPQTHVRYGAIDIKKAQIFINQIGFRFPENKEFNTAREIFEIINFTYQNPLSIFYSVCLGAQKYCEKITGGIPVTCHLVSYDSDIILKT